MCFQILHFFWFPPKKEAVQPMEFSPPFLAKNPPMEKPCVFFNLWRKATKKSIGCFFMAESDFGSKEKFGGLMSYTWSDIITNKSYRHYRILGE